MSRSRLGCLPVLWVLSCSSTDRPGTSPAADAAETTSLVDGSSGSLVLDARNDSTSTDDFDAAEPSDATVWREAPPPAEELPERETPTLPDASGRLELWVGPDGGTSMLKAEGELRDVSVEVPAGALSSAVQLVIQAAVPPTPKTGTTSRGVFVSIGPADITFDRPVTVRLPWTATGSPEPLAILMAEEDHWSAALDPHGDAEQHFLTATIRKTCSVGVFALTLSKAPEVLAMDPVTAEPGSVVFVRGRNFGLAPAWQAVGFDTGPEVRSLVRFGATEATVLAWQDEEIAVQMPAVGALHIVTPAGSTTFGAE